jgi:hypothetical protein
MIAAGIPAHKIIIGKPTTKEDAYNTGTITASNFASMVK